MKERRLEKQASDSGDSLPSPEVVPPLAGASISSMAVMLLKTFKTMTSPMRHRTVMKCACQCAVREMGCYQKAEREIK